MHEDEKQISNIILSRGGKVKSRSCAATVVCLLLTTSCEHSPSELKNPDDSWAAVENAEGQFLKQHASLVRRVEALGGRCSAFWIEGGMQALNSDTPVMIDFSDATDVSISGICSAIENERVALFLKNTGITDNTLSCLSHKHVIVLDLYGSNITDSAVDSINSMADLETLNLGETAVTDEGMSQLTVLGQLKSLSIAGNRITDVGVESLARATNLVTLSLVDTRMTDRSLAVLKGMRQLRVLKVSSGNLTSGALLELASALPNCRVSVLDQ